MRNVILTMMGLSLLTFSFSAFAEKVIITGQPLILEKRGDIYYVPDSYKPTQYQYVTIDGTQRVCFLEKRPDFSSLDVVSINVMIGTERASWNCYVSDPNYFVIQ